MQLRMMEVVRMRRTTIVILMTISSISITTSVGAPTAYDPRLEIKPGWQDNSLTPIISEPCSPTERCWEWLPAVPIEEADEILEKKSNNDRLREQPRIDGEVNSSTDPWKEDSRIFYPRARSTSSVVRQISPRPVKKDLFASRSWGPGGLPFSVLYMHPHTARVNNHSNTGTSEIAPTKGLSEANARRSFEQIPPPTASPVKHPNYRVAIRNGASGQPRRQYSIIPQLFISYGWGPLGK